MAKLFDWLILRPFGGRTKRHLVRWVSIFAGLALIGLPFISPIVNGLFALTPINATDIGLKITLGNIAGYLLVIQSIWFWIGGTRGGM